MLQWEVAKVKFLMNSNMTLTVHNLHQKQTQRCNKILKVKVTTAGSNQGHTMMMHTFNLIPMSLSSINILHITVSEIWPGQHFIGQGHYGKVKG